MGARYARRIEETPISKVQEQETVQLENRRRKLPPLGLSSPGEYRAAISAALNNESLRGAEHAAAEGHEKFPDDPELARLNRLLTPRPARIVPGLRAPDRTEAFQWLDEHGKEYQGQWIALGDKGLLASAPELKTLLRSLKEMPPNVLPLLIHLV